MSAYVLVQIEVTDPVRYAIYKEMAGPTVAQYGGRYIVRGGAVEELEGESAHMSTRLEMRVGFRTCRHSPKNRFR